MSGATVVATGKRWEETAPYAPGVEVVAGTTLLFVSGQVALDADGAVVAAGDMLAQARQAFANVQDVVEAAGARMADVVKLTYFVTDMSRWDEVATARREFFPDYLPASTTVEVRALHRPAYLIEIEAVVSVPSRDGT